MQPHKTLEDELLSLLDEGLLIDRSEKPYRPTVTIVGTQRASEDTLILVEDFCEQLLSRYPHCRLVVGETSDIEKAAKRTAEMMGIPCIVIPSANKGDWDHGSMIRDERCVAAASHVVAFDSSARSMNYKRIAERQRKHFSHIQRPDAA